MASMHQLILHNFRWKAISLALAVIVWFVIKPDAPNTRTYTADFTVNVLALADPAEKQVWHLNPPEARVRIRATQGMEVAQEDIVAFVNLAGTPGSAASSQTRRIQVDVPVGVVLVRVDPVSVVAQYSTLPVESGTNRVTKP